jgi:hypothetical protein
VFEPFVLPTAPAPTVIVYVEPEVTVAGLITTPPAPPPPPAPPLLPPPPPATNKQLMAVTPAGAVHVVDDVNVWIAVDVANEMLLAVQLFPLGLKSLVKLLNVPVLVNVWIVLPPEEVIVPPVNLGEPE